MPLNNPAGVLAWATTTNGGGAWSVGGVANDGSTPFIATGNTFGVSSWSGGESIIRFQPGPVFSGQTTDYWAPLNWMSLDSSDTDIGGSGPLILDVPGATPSQLVVSLGKDGNAYLLNRATLGGVSAPVAQAQVSSTPIIQAAAAYRTPQGTYVAFHGTGVGCSGGSGDLAAFRIHPASPPSINMAWCASQNGQASPFVTSTDGTNNVIVWGIGAEGDQRLHGFDGNTGAVVFNGGGSNELMAGTRRFSTGIAARGRIFVAADNRVYAFKLPSANVTAINLVSPTMLPNGAFQFGFTNTAGLNFTVLGSPDLSSTNWSTMGTATEVSPGQYQFTDPQTTNSAARFYRVSSP